MDTTPINTNMDFSGRAKIINSVIGSSASLPASFADISGGVYYNSTYGLLAISHSSNNNRYIPYISEVPSTSKLSIITNTGKLDTISNTTSNKFLYLNSSGVPSLSQYITYEWLDPNIITSSIIDNNNVLPTSKAVYDAIEDIQGIVGNYLPLTGGILTGALYMGNGDGIPIKFLQNTGLVGSIWSANGSDIRIDVSEEIIFSLRDLGTDNLCGGIYFNGDYDGNYFNITSYSPIVGFKSKILGFTEIGLKGDNLINFDVKTTTKPSISAVNTDDESQLNIFADHLLLGNADNYFHIGGNTLTGSAGTSIGSSLNKIKQIFTQDLYVDNLVIPYNNGISIKYFNQSIIDTLNSNSPNTILSETAIFNAINNKLSLATIVKDGMIPMLPTDGELYYLNGDNLWIEREWAVSTIDGKKYLSTGVGNFKSFNVSLVANGELSIGSEYLIMETLPTNDPNLIDSAFPIALYIGRNSLKPSTVSSVLHVAGSIRGSAFTTDNTNYWKMLGVGNGTFIPNKIIYVSINGTNYGIAATDNIA